VRGAPSLAAAILARASELDRGRPGDDTNESNARQLTVRFPIE